MTIIVDMRRIIALTFATLIGCASPTEPSAPWSDDFNAPWEEVVACWNARGYDTQDTPRPEILVRDDCRSKWADQDFFDGAIWVHGTHSHGRIEVCPDLAALRHEMSHHVADHIGAENVNGAGVCWL